MCEPHTNHPKQFVSEDNILMKYPEMNHFVHITIVAIKWKENPDFAQNQHAKKGPLLSSEV